MSEDVAPPRRTSRGRTFVYVLPCRDEDMLKVGFSRDPLERLRTLHRRYFAFFDLERALLIETDRLVDARRIERHLITTLADSRAPPPLVIRSAAAGYTEWFRGVSLEAEMLARGLAETEALVVHAPLRDWLHDRFAERSDLLYAWSLRMLEMIEYERHNLPPGEVTGQADRALRDALDACIAVGLPLEPLLPPAALAWYDETRAYRAAPV